MINNFLNEVSVYLYVTPSLIAQVEAYIVNDNKGYGEMYLLLSDELRRAFYAKIETSRVGNSIYEKLVLDNEDIIKPYFDNGLYLLSELIQEKYGIKKGESVYVVYLVIYRIIKSRLDKEWGNEYGDYYYDTSNMDLEETATIYFSIDTIDHDDLYTLGKLIYYLMNNGKFKNKENYLICYDEFIETYNKVKKSYEMNVFKKRLLKNTKEIDSNTNKTIDDIDLMNGAEFERFIAQLFTTMGYKTEVTKHSGDQGIDVIAEKNGMKIGIQAKCYSWSVGNSTIQEAAAGKNHYKLDKVIVVTNSSFTNSAKELANSNGVVLWDRSILKEKIV